MTNNVVDFDGVTRLDIPVPRILAKAAGAGLSDVVVIGFKEDGGFYFASSQASGPEVNWMLDVAKRRLLDVGS